MVHHNDIKIGKDHLGLIVLLDVYTITQQDNEILRLQRMIEEELCWMQHQYGQRHYVAWNSLYRNLTQIKAHYRRVHQLNKEESGLLELFNDVDLQTKYVH